MKILKRGQIESYFLIVVILAIAGFLIALYFLTSTKYNTENEICKVSVLSRATTPTGAKNYIPLKCYTTKYCLTKDMFGKCEEFAGETKVERVVLPSNPEQAARKIEEINANAKYDCWQMMGQGKLDIVGDFWEEIGLGSKQNEPTPVCVICSRIAIDKTSFSDSCKKEALKNEDEKQKCIKELNKTLSLVDINKYMETHKVPNSALTYAQTFSNKAFAKFPSANKINSDDEIMKKSGNIPDAAFIKDNFKSLDNSSTNLEKAYVFSQVRKIKGAKAFSEVLNMGAMVGMGAATTPVLNKAILNPYVLVTGLVVVGATAGYAAYNAHLGSEAAATYCGSFESSLNKKDENSVGCTIIQSVPYNHKYVNSLCEAIEGNP